jgi:SRSO17 transposase
MTTSRLSGLRWAVEQCFEEGKTELGMDHYEVRKYAGWHEL